MERRDLSHKEKLYLREQNVITETQCTLGECVVLDASCLVPAERYRGLPCFQGSQLCAVMR